MADVLRFTGITTIPEPPAAMLEKAKAWKMENCLVLGFNEQGEFVISGSFSDKGEMFLMLELARQWLLHSNPIPFAND